MVKESNPRKNPAVVALGRLGGFKGGPSLTGELMWEIIYEVEKRMRMLLNGNLVTTLE